MSKTINMPVNKEELMLIGLALLSYKEHCRNSTTMPSATKKMAIQQTNVLMQKIASNELSWDSIYAKSEHNTPENRTPMI